MHIHSLFAAHVENCFGNENGFRLETATRAGSQVTIVNFAVDSLPVQLYAEPTPVLEQPGYLHMDVEHRLLQLGGRGTRERILALKNTGLKTEPAFAAWLGLTGDAYAALLDLARLPEAKLAAWYAQRTGDHRRA